MVDRQWILDEIRRCAGENGGKALGRERFARATGIRESEWSGRYWVRWSDALREAGLDANEFNTQKLDDVALTRQLAVAVREFGRFPTNAEMRMHRRQHRDFPSVETLQQRLGTRRDKVAAVLSFARKHDEFTDVAQILAAAEPTAEPSPDARPAPATAQALGWVYLVRSGKHHKIGMTNDVGRREYEIRLQMPERAELVHKIETDDPAGIERYWHERFAAKRLNGEWFNLTASDVAAFKLRRRFM